MNDINSIGEIMSMDLFNSPNKKSATTPPRQHFKSPLGYVVKQKLSFGTMQTPSLIRCNTDVVVSPCTPMKRHIFEGKVDELFGKKIKLPDYDFTNIARHSSEVSFLLIEQLFISKLQYINLTKTLEELIYYSYSIISI